MEGGNPQGNGSSGCHLTELFIEDGLPAGFGQLSRPESFLAK